MWPGIEPRSPGPLAITLPAGPTQFKCQTVLFDPEIVSYQV